MNFPDQSLTLNINVFYEICSSSHSLIQKSNFLQNMKAYSDNKLLPLEKL